ncbi:TylF/MycF family methyltransferase [Helicobacter turcicus]|uniref:TylF/MycF family methyltransferase n=1 Tax=Helicobacter turcicus TaxID=2867412 RepID=UPI001C889B8F|nr:TylF/MycF family methyltransferase [Helicobacter turcicus]
MKAPNAILCHDFDKVIVASVCGENIITQLLKSLKIAREKIDSTLIDFYQQGLRSFLEKFSYLLKDKNLKGAVAELGVYQGDSAKWINYYFKERKIYLFDTFEGYALGDINADKDDEAREFGEGHLCDTSIKMVMDKMTYPQNCVIKKGVFPQSAKGVEDDFVFVNLDPDLYKVVLAGLEFFYPRLVKGGAIIVSYFSPHNGPKRALDAFLTKHHLKTMPIPLGFGNGVALVKE